MNFLFTAAEPKIRENAEFDDEYNLAVPSEEEVRILGHRLRNCQYFLHGIDQCREQQFQKYLKKENHDGFAPCKSLVDSYYYCMSQGQYGSHIEDAPVQQEFVKFQQCLFQKLNPTDFCAMFARNGVRDLYHEPSTKIRDTTI